MKLNEINTKIEEGKLLLMALAKLTCTVYMDKTPDKVLLILEERAKGILRKEDTVDDKPYSEEDYKKAKETGLDLDDWNDYQQFYGLGEREEYE